MQFKVNILFVVEYVLCVVVFGCYVLLVFQDGYCHFCCVSYLLSKHAQSLLFDFKLLILFPLNKESFSWYADITSYYSFLH